MKLNIPIQFLEQVEYLFSQRDFHHLHEIQHIVHDDCILIDSYSKILAGEFSLEEINILKDNKIPYEEIEPPIPLNEYSYSTSEVAPGADGVGTTPLRETWNYSNGAKSQLIRGYREWKVLEGTVPTTAVEYLNIDKLYEEGFTGQGVKVGVIDLNFNPAEFEHESINIAGAFTGGGQTHEHSAYMLSLVGGNCGSFKGVAPDAELYFASYYFGVATALSWLISQGCTVIFCCVYNFARYNSATMSAVKRAVDDGIIFCVATGNNTYAPNNLNPLASINGVVAVREFVGGDIENYDSTSFRYLPATSTFNKEIDFAAPVHGFGAKYKTQAQVDAEPHLTKPARNAWYWTTGGTSVSCPTVAGLFALLKQKYPNINGRVLVNFLKLISTDSIQGIPIPKL